MFLSLYEKPNKFASNVSLCLRPPPFLNNRRSGWQGKIDKVKCLDLCYSNVRDSRINRLSSLPALEELSVDSCLAVSDVSLGHLVNNDVIPNLQRLDLSDTNVSDAGMVHIAKMKHLTHLSLFYCNISNRGLLRMCCSPPKLRYTYMSCEIM